MVREVIWSKRARKNFDNIILYLESEWGEGVTTRFVTEVYHIIDLIELHPEMGKFELRDKGIRSFVITKHNTLFYRVNNTTIDILNIFDNRQDPKKKKF